ncbi:hypothetical protein MMC25_007163 [Agyrium rufum]|nr:hypothetical protein [Agyrium rufum]
MLPRRDVFDIRAQLMAEDSLEPGDQTLTGLARSDDIIPKVYEGGFKTWECSLDLARFIARKFTQENLIDSDHELHVIELGAGTAVPTTSRPKTIFTLCDYNPAVLSHASIPNCLLAFASQHPDLTPFPDTETISTPASLQTAFTTSLATNKIEIRGVSGGWSKSFCDLVMQGTPPLNMVKPSFISTEDKAPRHTLILASETIYAPSSLVAFTETILRLLEVAEAEPLTMSASTVLIASKKIYFGVGGGVSEFLRILESKGGSAQVVWDTDWDLKEGEARGIGRCILQVGR